MSWTVVLGYLVCAQLNFEYMEIKIKQYEYYINTLHILLSHTEAVTKWNSLVIFILAKHNLGSQKLPSSKI